MIHFMSCLFYHDKKQTEKKIDTSYKQFKTEIKNIIPFTIACMQKHEFEDKVNQT